MLQILASLCGDLNQKESVARHVHRTDCTHNIVCILLAENSRKLGVILRNFTKPWPEDNQDAILQELVELDWVRISNLVCKAN
jgi:hypothetical protein